jgi:hypothetical protein
LGAFVIDVIVFWESPELSRGLLVSRLKYGELLLSGRLPHQLTETNSNSI